MASDDPCPRPKIGLILPHWDGFGGSPAPGWADLSAIARAAEDAGFDSLWLVDHLLAREEAIARQIAGDDFDPTAFQHPLPTLGVWESWSLIAALAAVTQRVELGHLVTCVGYRNPALLAKMADTVDEISGGRLILGLGAGDFEDEHHSFGYPWERRVSRFEEALRIIVPLLRTGAVDFQGEFHQARHCELRPRGPRPAGPPILLGALAHAPRMLRLTAEYADLWNAWIAFGTNSPERMPPLRAAVDAACLKAGRDPETLQRTLAVGVTFDGALMSNVAGGAVEHPITGSLEEIAETLWSFVDEGITHLMLLVEPRTLAPIEQLGRVIELMDRGRA